MLPLVKDNPAYLLIYLSSFALSIKMSILLYAPAIALVLLQRKGFYKSLLLAIFVVCSQLAASYSFWISHPLSYFRGAFDFTRVFMYKWTVNWKMLDEETFLDPQVARTLLIGHILTLSLFCAYKWCRYNDGLFQLLRRSLADCWSSPSRSPIPSNCTCF